MCGNCGNIYKYELPFNSPRVFKDFGDLVEGDELDKKEKIQANIGKFNQQMEVQKKLDQQQHKIEEKKKEINRSGSAVQLSDDYQPLPRSAYKTPKYDNDDFDDDIYIDGDKYTLYNPNDN